MLLSAEGINLFVAGSREAIDRFVDELRQDAAFGDLQPKESLSDYPKRHPNRVPAQIAQTSSWFKVAVQPDVSFQKFRWRAEAELRRDSPDFANALSIIEGLAQRLHPSAVHIHDAVHELHVVRLTSLDHFAQIRRHGWRRAFRTSHVCPPVPP